MTQAPNVIVLSRWANASEDADGGPSIEDADGDPSIEDAKHNTKIETGRSYDACHMDSQLASFIAHFQTEDANRGPSIEDANGGPSIKDAKHNTKIETCLSYGQPAGFFHCTLPDEFRTLGVTV